MAEGTDINRSQDVHETQETNIYDVLSERGYIAQCTHPEEVRKLLSKPGVTFYIGFDPTADSLHAGHFIQVMIMAHMQKAGHRPIALMGGGTGMIGDPSGRSDLRKMMTRETVQHNVDCIKTQMSRLIEFGPGKATIANNADWLLNLNYIDFLREFGPCFSVNRMLTAECYKKRLEVGLTFLEFNYMLMQAYDFYKLHESMNCRLELGGDDQWSNILAGTDLIRRKTGEETYGLTFRLLTTSEGIKMGKTANGALWLDPDKCPPFEFYQFWRNIADADVINCLKMVTFVSMDEIRAYEKLEGSEINTAKKRLAFEVTKLIHGEEIAAQCQQQAIELFEGGGRSQSMETAELGSSDLGKTTILDSLLAVKLIPSKGEGRRLMQQNGLFLNEKVIADFSRTWCADDFANGEAIIRKGKKKYYRFILK